MANNSFRDSVNSLGWSRRDPDLPVNTGTSSNTPFLSRLQSYNPFSEGGYVQLPTHNEGPGAPLPAAFSLSFCLVTLRSPDPPVYRCVIHVMRLQFLRREDSFLPCLFMW